MHFIYAQFQTNGLGITEDNPLIYENGIFVNVFIFVFNVNDAESQYL